MMLFATDLLTRPHNKKRLRNPVGAAVVTVTACFFALAILTVPASSAVAQAEAPAETAVSAADTDLTPEEEKALEGLKHDLAVKLHEVRPTSLQVEEAIKQVAERLPYQERDVFLKRVMSYIDLDKLEQVSIDAMMEVFTVAELEAMIEYFRTPEARSISEKMPLYQGVVRPEIKKMLDKALLDLRTGRLENESPGR